jgi:nucleoside 2-deoxyribosyltransferase
MIKVYLAGPISGLSYDDSEDWRINAKSMLKEFGIDGYSPLRRKDFLKSREVLGASDVIEGSYDVHPLSTARGIFTRDRNDVKTSDAILINFLGADRVSIGTVMEAAFAFDDRIPVIAISEPDNIHWKHPFIQEAIGYRVDTLEEGIDVVASILLP